VGASGAGSTGARRKCGSACGAAGKTRGPRFSEAAHIYEPARMFSQPVPEKCPSTLRDWPSPHGISTTASIFPFSRKSDLAAAGQQFQFLRFPSLSNTTIGRG
jgi:hypothetical protein